MSGRVVYDSNPEIKALASYARRVKETLRIDGIDTLDDFECDFVMCQYKAAINPVVAAMTIKRWRDQSAKA